jgi:hypothetical protein
VPATPVGGPLLMTLTFAEGVTAVLCDVELSSELLSNVLEVAMAVSDVVGAVVDVTVTVIV